MCYMSLKMKGVTLLGEEKREEIKSLFSLSMKF